IPENTARPSTLKTKQVVLSDDAPKLTETEVIRDALILLPVPIPKVALTNSTIVSSLTRSIGMEVQAEECATKNRRTAESSSKVPVEQQIPPSILSLKRRTTESSSKVM
ncbi:unnamed protein product, partial [Ilex paraguariensis]